MAAHESGPLPSMAMLSEMTPEEHASLEAIELYDTVAGLLGTGDTYNMKTGLPNPDIVLMFIEQFHQVCRTKATGSVVIPEIYGLPEDIAENWNRSELIFPQALVASDATTIEYLLAEKGAAMIPAYSLDFEITHSQIPNQPSEASIHLRDKSSGVGIVITKDNSREKVSFAICSEAGAPVGYMQLQDMILLLNTLIRDPAGDPVTEKPDDKTIDALFEELGSTHGVSRRQYLMTHDLYPQDGEDGAEVFGAVLYTETGSTAESERSMIVERHRRDHERDADVVSRWMINSLSSDLQAAKPPSTPATIAMHEVVSRPASYNVEMIDCSKVLPGTAHLLEPDTAQLKRFVSTLQEVIASACEQFPPPAHLVPDPSPPDDGPLLVIKHY
ncbi:MAG: hypothetical protein JWM81_396 [Candidatus Saccharibacteria bacterium]|nr:hypothetical protein [Candidatus Saccharibacteria bacterium]